uniref:ANK_REP_REGION domain-containing protein n=1 Tax=Heterorhabditis bacteriophora TaxID=37862 RepID=A0A1I7WF08_HETBA
MSEAGHLDIVRRLLESGADVDKKDSEERTALMAAAFMNHYQVVELLLDHGANIQVRNGIYILIRKLIITYYIIYFTKPANLYNSLSILVFYLSIGGSDINLPDAHGRLCIHLAAYHGDKNLQRLMSAMVCIDVQDSLGRTPLMLAASQGQLHSVELLMSNGEIHRLCLSVLSLYLSLFSWSLFLSPSPSLPLSLSLSLSPSSPSLPLSLSLSRRLLLTKLRLHLFCTFKLCDKNECSMNIHNAVRVVKFILLMFYKFILSRIFKNDKFLIVHGDVELTRALAMENTVNAADRLGNHPLIIACQHNNVEVVVCELLNMGAPSTRLSLNGQSALRVAALAGNTKIVQVLAERTIDWEQLDMDGTPLVHSLLINKQTAMAELLLTLGALTSSRDIHGRTCAHVVSSTNDLCGARMLRRFGCSFESTDNGGRTPLMTAVWAGNTCLSAYLLDTVGVSPNAVDKQGASALSIAAQLGHRDMVILLLRFGAEPSLADLEGRTALDVAKISGHEHIKMILQTACGSADSSGFGSVPNSPMDTKSLEIVN